MWPSHLDYSRQECIGILRGLELKAYSSVLDALRAGGPLTSPKSDLLAELRKVFNISEDRHKAEVRRSVNSEILTTVCERLSGCEDSDDWKLEGRRIIALLPRAPPITGYTSIATKAKDDISSLNKELPPPHETRTVQPLPPLQRDVKSPEPVEPASPASEFVKPEPVATPTEQNGTLSPDKIKTELKEEPGVSCSEDETGMVYLPSGMAVRLSEDKAASKGKAGGGASGKRKRSVSKSIEVFPRGLPSAASLQTSPANSRVAANRRGCTSSPPRKYTSPVSPVHQAGHGYARPPPPCTTGSSSIPTESGVPQSPVLPSTASTNVTAMLQAAVALDLQNSGKRGAGRPPGAGSPATTGVGRGGGEGVSVRVRGARAPRARGSRSRGRAAQTRGASSSVVAASVQHVAASVQHTPVNLQHAAANVPQHHQIIYANQQNQVQQEQLSLPLQQQLPQQPQQMIAHQNQVSQTNSYASLGTLTPVKSSVTSRLPGALYSRETLNQLQGSHTGSINTTNPVTNNLTAQYISTTPIKAINLSRATNCSGGAVLTPVSSIAVTTNNSSNSSSMVQTAVRALHPVKPVSAGVVSGGQLIHMKLPTTQQQHIKLAHHIQGLPQVQQQLQGAAQSLQNYLAPQQQQPLDLQQPHRNPTPAYDIHSDTPSRPAHISNDMNGKKEAVTSSALDSRHSDLACTESSQAISVTKPVATPSVQQQPATLFSMGLANNVANSTTGGIKLLSNTKIVPKSGGPVYVVRNSGVSGQRVLNQARVVTVSVSGGSPALASGGATFVSSGMTSLRGCSPGMQVIRNIRTTTTPNNKSVIVVKPGHAPTLSTGTSLRGTALTTVNRATAPIVNSVGVPVNSSPTEIVLRAAAPGGGGSTSTTVSASGNLQLRAPLQTARVLTRPAATIVRQQHSNGATLNNTMGGSGSIPNTIPVVGGGAINLTSNVATSNFVSGNNFNTVTAGSGNSSGNSSGNTFLMDLSQNTATQSITLNNSDAMLHRVGGKPIMSATKQLQTMTVSGAAGNKQYGKIFIANSSVGDSVTGVQSSKSGNIWLHTKSGNDQSLNRSNVYNKVVLPESIQRTSPPTHPTPATAKTMQPNNSGDDDTNYSDIFSRALEQANIPTNTHISPDLPTTPPMSKHLTFVGASSVPQASNNGGAARCVTLQSRASEMCTDVSTGAAQAASTTNTNLHFTTNESLNLLPENILQPNSSTIMLESSNNKEGFTAPGGSTVNNSVSSSLSLP